MDDLGSSNHILPKNQTNIWSLSEIDFFFLSVPNDDHLTSSLDPDPRTQRYADPKQRYLYSIPVH